MSTDRRDKLPKAWVRCEEDELPEVNATFSDGKDGLVIVDLVDKVLAKKISVRNGGCRGHISLTRPVASSNRVAPRLQKSAAVPYEISAGPSSSNSGAA